MKGQGQTKSMLKNVPITNETMKRIALYLFRGLERSIYPTNECPENTFLTSRVCPIEAKTKGRTGVHL